MIFISQNEKGEIASDLILKDIKTVTRRMKPEIVGKSRAVQPGRGKHAVCRITIKSSTPHTDWLKGLNGGILKYVELEEEAKKEGFGSWHGMMEWFTENKTDIMDTHRIEFEREVPT